jgi:DNA-directed RNA polymerase specialized sigma subunit
VKILIVIHRHIILSVQTNLHNPTYLIIFHTKIIRGTNQMDGRYLLENEKKVYEITQLRDRHKEIIRLILLGHENTEIASILNITPQTVSNVRNSQLAQVELMSLQEARDNNSIDIAKQIQEIAPAALEILHTMIDRTNRKLTTDPFAQPSNLEVTVAQDLLNRAGHGSINKNISINKSMPLTQEELALMRERAFAGFTGKNVSDAEIINN